MSCKICSITNGKLRQAIESELVQFDGVLSSKAKAELIEKHPDFVAMIDSISPHDCEMHFNFHQSIGRNAQACSISYRENEGEATKSSSLADDVGKDEAEILLDLLNTQYATFTAITNKINGAIQRVKPEEMTGLLINPGTAQFYKELGDSVRATVRELRELNTAVNGRQDGALEGLKSLAVALMTNQKPTENNEPVDEQTTTMFND